MTETPTTARTGIGTAASPDELVTAHLPLVGHAVRATIGRVPRSVDVADLEAAAMLGLVQAARAYDPDRGIPFARFARHRIDGALLDELRARDWASRSVRAGARRMRAAEDEVAGRAGRPATVAETAAAMGCGIRDVERLRDDLHRASLVNLESMVDDGAPFAGPPSKAPGPEADLEHKELLGYLTDAVDLLPARLRAVVVGYFLEGRPMAELAAELEVTESRISQMRAEAVTLLRAALDAHLGAAPAEQAAAPVAPASAAARRRAAYCTAVGAAHDPRARLDLARPPAVPLATAL
ncbi:MAG: sigma-70 family RNA polymerase sigma factor [Acidimicrobiia bacterium]